LLTKQYKSYEVARMLTKYFDINKQDKAGKTVLFYAVLMGNTEAVKFFISAGGDVSIKDNQGRKAADQITLLDLQNASSMSRVLLSAEK
ncbi:TPA: ankyrin repeat domain-containing protein, partial [Klebsiella pneumoniae]